MNSIEDGHWAIWLAKSAELPGSLLGVLIAVFSMCGNAASHVATGGARLNPGFFWIGQLAFYGFVSVAILKLRPRKRRGGRESTE